MKLELKHLTSYLPYDLKGINHLKDISTLGIKDEVFTYTNFYENKRIKEKFTYLSIDSFLKEKYKPILFPLSSLTKEDIKNFYQLNNDDLKSIDWKEWAEDLMFFIKAEETFQLSQFEYLFSKKFDVFGLIDAGLAEPVTEDFNPYK